VLVGALPTLVTDIGHFGGRRHDKNRLSGLEADIGPGIRFQQGASMEEIDIWSSACARHRRAPMAAGAFASEKAMKSPLVNSRVTTF
jgi:hypothetical protein